MATLEAIRRRIESTKDLQSVVKTMKGLAAANIWHYEQAVKALVDYSRTVELGFQVVLKDRLAAVRMTDPAPDKRLGAVIIGSDQGMVGRFNEQIVTFSLNEMNKLQIKRENRSLLSIGVRVTGQLEMAKQPIEESFSIPGSIEGITPMVQEILVRLEAWRKERNLDQIVLFHNQPLTGAAYRPHLVQLLPINLDWLQSLQEKPWPTRVLPTFTMEWEQLFSALIRQYFFVTLYRAFAESLASENASRLAAMQVAEKNIEESLDELQALFHRERQRTITEE
ncbi:MAG TPA: F0F1 ATP synthase subunit gamma, partial [Anaerolineae bacterium]